jgi:preprotein translocase subunit Sec61beta
MSKEKINMPSGIGGLVRYFDEYKSKIEFKPGVVIIMVIVVIIIMIILHSSGRSWFGI